MFEEFIKHVNIIDLNKGINYDNRKVRYIGTNLTSNGSRDKFAVFSEHTSKSYVVTIEEDESGDVLNCSCTCPQYNLTDSCKHIAAVLIKFEGEYFWTTKETTLQSKTTNLLNQIKIATKNQDIVKTEARIIPYLKLEKEYDYYYEHYNEYYQLRFKIGATKFYALGNKVNKLIDTYHTDGSIKFGKDFVYNNRKYYFNTKSKQMLDLLELSYAKTSYYKNFLIPTKTIFDRLLLIIDDIYVEAPCINKVLPIVKGLPFNYKVLKKDNTHTINIDYDLTLLKPLTADYSYLIDNNAIYKLNEVEKIIAENILEEEIDQLTFSNQEFQDFKDYLVPSIKNKMILDDSVDDLVIVNTPDVKLYFDILEDYIEGKIIFKYKDREINYFDKEDKVIVRDKQFENTVFTNLKKYGFDQELRLYDINEIGEFIQNGLNELTEDYEVFTSEKLKNTNLIKKVQGTTSFSIGKDNILNYEFKLNNISVEELDKIFLNLKNKKKYYKLKSGDILDLLDPSIKELEELKEDLELTEDSGEIPKFKALYLDSLKTKNKFIKTNSLFDDFVKKFKNYKNASIEFTEEEQTILRLYQKEGVKWLYNLYKCELGGILADEMGLGKSLQTIIFISKVLKEEPYAKILIVTPTSLVYNWDNEFRKFSDKIKRSIFTGLRKERHKQLKNYTGNVYITSYGLLREDLDIYREMNFKVMVIDEAQNIKNPTAMLTKSVKSIKSTVKVALTGTPIENSILELWSIFDYIMPGFLSSKNKFKEKYKMGEDFDEETNVMLNKLKNQVSPFILRRKKNEVLKDLPEKLENNIYINLSEEEKKIYASLVQDTKKQMEELVKTGFNKNKMQILTLLTRLRQVCIDPRIIFDGYKKPSSKIIHLLEVIKESIKNGHKILLFTSFKTALNIVKEELDKEQITNYVIDGSVSSKKRQELVDKFNKDDTNIFLIMLKSGGTGLNLTSADIVIHLDLWWNPQAENQATDRAHRIGQKNIVEVIKLIMTGTIEEKILNLQEKKKVLSDKIIEKEQGKQDTFQNLSVEDIRELLRFNNE